MIWPETDMHRQLNPIEVKPVKWGICHDPLRDLQHVFILDQEIDRRTKAITYRSSLPIHFMRRMLITLRVDTTGNVPGQ
jgi:hypothetical protein